MGRDDGRDRVWVGRVSEDKWCRDRVLEEEEEEGKMGGNLGVRVCVCEREIRRRKKVVEREEAMKGEEMHGGEREKEANGERKGTRREGEERKY